MLIICIFFLTGSSSIGVLCWSFHLPAPLRALPFSPALSLCYSSGHRCVICMTSVILLTFFLLLYFDCVRFISLSCVPCFHAFSLLAPRTGGRPESSMFTRMCSVSGAVLDEQNVITRCMYSSDYDFLFSCCLSFFLSLCVCCRTLLYEKLSCGYSSLQAALFFCCYFSKSDHHGVFPGRNRHTHVGLFCFKLLFNAAV